MNHLVTIIEIWGLWAGVITRYLTLCWALGWAGVSTCGSCTTRPAAGQATDDYAGDEARM